MKRFTFSIIVLIFSIFVVHGQKTTEPEKLINDFLSAAKTNAIKTDFTLSVVEKNVVNSQNSSGTFIMKGNKFLLEMEDMKAWFDGKTQWSYINNEVSITEPTDKELGETNPLAILSGYKTKLTVRFSKTKSTQYHIIEMIPKIKKYDYSKVEVKINKINGNLSTIKLIAKNGITSLLTLTNYQKGIKIVDNTFTFDKTKYKGVVINDLR